jgi:hypothetical protein
MTTTLAHTRYRLSAAEVSQYCEHPSMVGRVGPHAELGEDAGDVPLNRGNGYDEFAGDEPVGSSFGDQGEDLALSFGQIVNRVVRSPPAGESSDDSWIDGAPTLCYSMHGRREVLEVPDARLQQISEASRLAAQNRQRVLLIGDLGKDQNGHERSD